VTDLHKEKANKKEFEGRTKKLKPDLVLLNGHGDNVSVTGHNNEVIVKDGENSNLLKNKITYAVACSSAKILGEACADSKTTYIGYTEYFVLNLDRRYFSNPLCDEKAGRFLEPSNKVALSLIKGHTAKEASKNSKKAFRENLILLLTKNNPNVDEIDDAKNLYWNMTHQVCLGNGEAKL